MSPEDMEVFVGLVKDCVQGYDPEMEHFAEMQSLKLDDAIRQMCLQWADYTQNIQQLETVEERIQMLNVTAATLLVENFLLHAKLFKIQDRSFDLQDYLNKL